jgi:hypothetical protein
MRALTVIVIPYIIKSDDNRLVSNSHYDFSVGFAMVMQRLNAIERKLDAISKVLEEINRLLEHNISFKDWQRLELPPATQDDPIVLAIPDESELAALAR